MDHGLSQNYSAYSNTFDVFSNGLNTRSSNSDIPETVFMAFPQQRSAQQCQQQLQQQAHQQYQHNQQHLQQNLLQQQSNQQHQFSPPTHQHLPYEQQKLQQQLQQLHLPQQNSQQQALNGHQIQQQQQYQQQQDLHNGSQQQLQMSQYSNNQQHLQQNHQALNNQHAHSHGQANPASTQNYSMSTMSSAYNTTALNYTSPLPDGASLLNPTHVMFQPKPEPPSYAVMAENHMTFAQLAAGHNQDGSSFSGNQPNGSQMDNYQNNYSSPTYNQNYRDNYESGSPESVNSSSPPAGLITGEYVDNGPSMGLYSSSPSPPRASYGYGSPQNAFVPSTAGMVSEPYVYPPTDCPPYTIPQIKTETASPCSTPTPHQTHIDTHPYARPSPGSSPRVCRRMPIDSNVPSPKSGSTQTGSPTSSRRAHVLPPCKVCGVQATGFHYGVNTCEACKGFFRRSIIRKEEYTCLKSSKCIIEPGKRNLCGSCRYQKCIDAGMSVEGIKTGRYTYQKRTKDILELQQLKKELSHARNQETKRIKEVQTSDLLARVAEVAKNHPDIINMHDAVLVQQKYLEEKQMLTDLFGKMERVNAEDYVYALENLGLELDDRREITNQFPTLTSGLSQGRECSISLRVSSQLRGEFLLTSQLSLAKMLQKLSSDSQCD